MGVGSLEGYDDTRVGLDDEDVENHYHLLGKETIGGGVSVGMASREGCNDDGDDEIYSRVGLDDEDVENHYYLLSKETIGGGVSVGVTSQEGPNDDDETYSRVGLDNEDVENHYHLLGREEWERLREETVCRVLKRPGDDDSDYADPDEEEMENVCHVLGDSNRERRGEEGPNCNQSEPTAYEVPVTSGRGNNY